MHVLERIVENEKTSDGPTSLYMPKILSYYRKIRFKVASKINYIPMEVSVYKLLRKMNVLKQIKSGYYNRPWRRSALLGLIYSGMKERMRRSRHKKDEVLLQYV